MTAVGGMFVDFEVKNVDGSSAKFSDYVTAGQSMACRRSGAGRVRTAEGRTTLKACFMIWHKEDARLIMPGRCVGLAKTRLRSKLSRPRTTLNATYWCR